MQVLAAMAIAASTEEACKVRLNFAAYLSEGFRNREAMKVIKDSRASQPPNLLGVTRIGERDGGNLRYVPPSAVQLHVVYQ